MRVWMRERARGRVDAHAGQVRMQTGRARGNGASLRRRRSGRHTCLVSAISETLPAADLPFRGGLRRLLGAVRNWLSAASLDSSEEEGLRLLQFAASRFGDKLLRAGSRDDLDDRLDELLDDPSFHHVAALMGGGIDWERVEVIEDAAWPDAFQRAVGAGQLPLLDEADRLMAAWAREIRRLASELAAGSGMPAAEEVARRSPVLLTSPDVPPELAMATAGGLRASATMLAFVWAAAHGHPIEPWLSRALAERLVAGLRANLRLLASMPGSEVDESIVALDQRWDLEAIARRHALARQHAEKSLAEARGRAASGDA